MFDFTQQSSCQLLPGCDLSAVFRLCNQTPSLLPIYVIYSKTKVEPFIDGADFSLFSSNL